MEMYCILTCSLIFNSGQRGKNQCDAMRCNQTKGNVTGEEFGLLRGFSSAVIKLMEKFLENELLSCLVLLSNPA